MGAIVEIRTALNAYLAAMPSVPPIAWENRNMQYTEQQTWIQAHNIFVDKDAAALGPDALNRIDGMYKLNVNSPADKGDIQISSTVDDILSYFKRGTEITSPGGVIVTCMKAFTQASLEDRGWYVTPITVWWYAYVQNQ